MNVRVEFNYLRISHPIFSGWIISSRKLLLTFIQTLRVLNFRFFFRELHHTKDKSLPVGPFNVAIFIKFGPPATDERCNSHPPRLLDALLHDSIGPRNTVNSLDRLTDIIGQRFACFCNEITVHLVLRLYKRDI